MLINQDSTYVLKAKLTSTVATSQLNISVTYKDNTDVYHPDVIIETNNTTAVTLLSAPSNGVVNIVELIKIYNPDIQANTVQILANDVVIYNCTIDSNQSVIIPQEKVSNSAFASANTDLSNLSITGKAKASNLAMPSDSFIPLSLNAATETVFNAPADGYYSLIAVSSATGQQFWIKSNNSGEIGSGTYSSGSGQYCRVLVPVRKNNTVNVYSPTTPFSFRFHYAQGAV